MNESSSRVWLITGCSSGLGQALAHHALRQGDRVVATARDVSSLADLCTEPPESTLALELDITVPEQIEVAVEQARQRFGRIDVLVNNAGSGLLAALEEATADELAAMLAVNFTGPIRLIQRVLPAMRPQRSGLIINISAAAAIANYPGFAFYGAAKSALECASEALVAELAPFGVRVMIVQPGPFRTAFIGRSLAHATAPMPEYDATRGRFGKMLATMDGRQSGDPAKAAAAIYSAATSEKPPIRLTLGKYAHDKQRRQWASANAELATWEPVALPTDFST